ASPSLVWWWVRRGAGRAGGGAHGSLVRRPFVPWLDMRWLVSGRPGFSQRHDLRGVDLGPGLASLVVATTRAVLADVDVAVLEVRPVREPSAVGYGLVGQVVHVGHAGFFLWVPGPAPGMKGGAGAGAGLCFLGRWLFSAA